MVQAARPLHNPPRMKAIILVAGVSRRLYPLTEYHPKCLMELGGRTIFDFQMEALLAAGIREVCLVVGYRREQIIEHAERTYSNVRFTYRINHHFFETNTAHSLWCAGDEFVNQDFVYLNGDVLFEPKLLQRLLDSPVAAALAVEAKRCGEEEVKVIVDDERRIHGISKQLDPEKCLGEFIGVARFCAPMNAAFLKALDQLKAEGARNAYFEAALDRIAPEFPLHAVDVTDLPCIEIDFVEDYEAARRNVLTRFGRD